MKRLVATLFISFFLVTVLAAAEISLAKDNYFPVETEVVNRTATTYFVYAGIDSVEIINADKKSQKTKLKKTEYTYNKSTACISFKNPMPYENCIAKVKGLPSVPYSCYLKDFDGTKDELLVILNNLTAVENKDYVYDSYVNKYFVIETLDLNTTAFAIKAIKTNKKSAGEKLLPTDKN